MRTFILTVAALAATLVLLIQNFPAPAQADAATQRSASVDSVGQTAGVTPDTTSGGRETGPADTTRAGTAPAAQSILGTTEAGAAPTTEAVADTVKTPIETAREALADTTKLEPAATKEVAVDTTGLEVPSYRLEDMYVTAAKLTGAVEKMPAAVFIIQRPEIEQGFDETLVQVLQEKEGMNSGSYGSYGALELISLRGSRFGSVPTLLDGITLNNEQNGAVDLNSIPSSMLQRIEVLRGPLGLLQGGNGVVGVVNFVTAEPVRKEKPVARVDLTSGSFNFRKHVANFSNYYGTLGTFFGIEGAFSDGTGAYRDYSSTSYFGKLNYDFGANRKVAFLVSSYKSELRTLREAKQKSDATRLQMVSSISMGEESRLELRAFHSGENTDYRDPFVTTLSEFARYGALVDFYKYGTRTGDIALGGGFTRSTLDCEDGTTWKPRIWEGYVFAEDELKVGSEFKGLVSVRADRHSTFGTELSPCVSLWREMEDGKIWFSTGRGFNPPTLNDLFWPMQVTQWAGWTYVTQGNEKLEAESSWMSELGTDLYLRDRSIHVGASGYVSRTTDFIQWASTVSQSSSTVTYTPLNTEQVDARGIEAGMAFAFRREPVAGANITVQEVENGENQSLPYMPQFRANFWLSKSVRLLPDLVVNAGVDGTYEGKYTEPFGSSQGPFFVMGGKISMTLAGVTAFARLYNATDETYPSRNLEFAPGEQGPNAVYYRMPEKHYDFGVLVRLLD